MPEREHASGAISASASQHRGTQRVQGACGRAQLGADGLLVVAERAGEELVQLGRNLLGRRLAGLALTLRPGQRVSAAAQRRAEAGANARMHARTISANGACGARRARRRRRGRTGARARRSAEGAGGVRRSAKGAAKAKARGCATRRSGQAGMRSPQHSRSASLSEVSPARGRANRPAGAPRSLRSLNLRTLPARFTGLPCTPGRVGCA